jgi:hypothetical protein
MLNLEQCAPTRPHFLITLRQRRLRPRGAATISTANRSVHRLQERGHAQDDRRRAPLIRSEKA